MHSPVVLVTTTTLSTLLAITVTIISAAPAPQTPVSTDLIVLGKYNTYSDDICQTLVKDNVIFPGQCRELPKSGSIDGQNDVPMGTERK